VSRFQMLMCCHVSMKLEVEVENGGDHSTVGVRLPTRVNTVVRQTSVSELTFDVDVIFDFTMQAGVRTR
jgi:hypothetical protein